MQFNVIPRAKIILAINNSLVISLVTFNLVPTLEALSVVTSLEALILVVCNRLDFDWITIQSNLQSHLHSLCQFVTKIVKFRCFSRHCAT